MGEDAPDGRSRRRLGAYLLVGLGVWISLAVVNAVVNAERVRRQMSEQLGAMPSETYWQSIAAMAAVSVLLLVTGWYLWRTRRAIHETVDDF